jgi:hypothetical protein
MRYFNWRTVGSVMASLGLAVGLMVGIAPRPARAQVASSRFYNYNGNLCQQVTGTLGHSIYGVHNTSTTTDAQVECPITFEFIKTSGSTTYQIGGLQLSGYNRSTSKHLACFLKAVNTSDGSFTTISAAQIPFGTGTGFKTVDNNANFFSIGPSMSLFLECQLPKSEGGSVSHIQNYAIGVLGPI